MNDAAVSSTPFVTGVNLFFVQLCTTGNQPSSKAVIRLSTYRVVDLCCIRPKGTNLWHIRRPMPGNLSYGTEDAILHYRRHRQNARERSPTFPLQLVGSRELSRPENIWQWLVWSDRIFWCRRSVNSSFAPDAAPSYVQCRCRTASCTVWCRNFAMQGIMATHSTRPVWKTRWPIVVLR